MLQKNSIWHIEVLQRECKMDGLPAARRTPVSSQEPTSSTQQMVSEPTERVFHDKTVVSYATQKAPAQPYVLAGACARRH